MKKIYIFLILGLLMSSCGTSVVPQDATTLQTYTGESFSIDTPNMWINLNGNTDVLPRPSEGKVALALASPDFVNGFSNNLLVLEESLEYDISSSAFSKMNHDSAKTVYKSYSGSIEKDIEFVDKETSILYIFSARYNDKTPELTFMQTARICDGKKSFFLTIALPVDITDTAKYEEILKSFQCIK